MSGEKEEKIREYKATGEIKSLTSSKYSTPLVVTNGHDVLKLSQNVYLAQQLCNLETQLFSDIPEVTILNENQEKDIELSKRYETMFLKAGLEKSMHITFYEYMLYGCSVKTFSFKYINDKLELTEIRDLPADSFANSPEAKNNYETPNPLMAGLCVDRNTGRLYVEQCVGTNNTRIPIKKFKIMKEPSSPEPFGEAYCLPLYPIIAQIDEADKALSSQINRVGTPIIMPKLTDDSAESVEELNEWAIKFLHNWGQKAGFLIPRGVELIAPNIYESQGAYERLESLKKVIGGFFNPTIVLQRAESGIGGSDDGAQQIYYNFLKYTQRWIAKEYEEIANNLLRLSGYFDYSCHITLPSCQIVKSQQVVAELTLLLQGNAITKEEVRRNCKNLDLDEWTPELEEKLKEMAFNQLNQPQEENPEVSERETIEFKEPIQEIIPQVNVEESIQEPIEEPPKDTEVPEKEGEKTKSKMDEINDETINEILNMMKNVEI